MQPLVVATRNAHKVAEIRNILADFADVSDLAALSNAPEVEETGTSFEDNAKLKAVAISEVFDGWVLADDSGLEVDALDGAPGVRSARFAGERATDIDNNTLLLERLSGVRGKNRSARFRCALALARSGACVATFSGSVEGMIINTPKGRAGFGYDPLFVPAGYCETFGQLPPDLKNTISHRARALMALRDWMQREAHRDPPIQP